MCEGVGEVQKDEEETEVRNKDKVLVVILK